MFYRIAYSIARKKFEGRLNDTFVVLQDSSPLANKEPGSRGSSAGSSSGGIRDGLRCRVPAEKRTFKEDEESNSSLSKKAGNLTLKPGEVPKDRLGKPRG